MSVAKWPRRQILKMAVGAAAGSTVAGWSRRARAASPRINNLTVAAQSLPRTIDPNYDSNLGASLGHRFLFDTLVTAFRGKPEPQLALSWQGVNPTTWRFRLRRDVKFHNGEVFNAESVKFTMDRILDPNGKSAWKARFPTVERVNVVDESTVDIVSRVPNAALVNVMATIWMQPAKYFQQVGEVKFNQAPIGTGPFRFKEWRPDVFLTMEGNGDYWGGPATVGQLTVRADRRVRRALAHATDVAGIHRALVAPHARMAQCQIYGADTFGFNPNMKPHTYDVNKAKQLLAEAGHGQGFTVHMDSSSGMFFREKEVTEALLNQWAKVGVKLERHLRKHPAPHVPQAVRRAVLQAAASAEPGRTPTDHLAARRDAVRGGLAHSAVRAAEHQRPGQGPVGRHVQPRVEHVPPQGDHGMS